MWSSSRRSAIWLLCWVGLLSFSDVSLPVVAEDRAATILAKQGIAATGEDTLRYLQQSLPSAETEADLQVLVNQLGASKFIQRELAERQLARRGKQVELLLRQATESADAEIRLRAKRLLESLNASYPPEVVFAALQVVEREKPSGAVETLLAILPVNEEAWLREAIFRALRSVSGVDDKPVLEKALEDESPRCRAGALHALGKFAAPERLGEFDKALQDRDAQVRLVAAWEITTRGHQRGLAALVRLLSSSDVRLREMSVRTLREATGQSFDFDARQSIELQQRALVAWKRWMEAHPAVELKTPLSELFQETNLANTTWRLVYTLPNSGPKEHHVVFHPNGRLENQNAADKTDNDSWSTDGLSVSLKFNNNYVEYVGAIAGDGTMAGTALNVKGARWKWKATRVR